MDDVLVGLVDIIRENRGENYFFYILESVDTEILCCIHCPLLIRNGVCCLPAGTRRPKWGFE